MQLEWKFGSSQELQMRLSCFSVVVGRLSLTCPVICSCLYATIDKEMSSQTLRERQRRLLVIYLLYRFGQMKI